MTRETIRRLGFLLVTALAAVAAVLAGAANWPGH